MKLSNLLLIGLALFFCTNLFPNVQVNNEIKEPLNKCYPDEPPFIE